MQSFKQIDRSRQDGKVSTDDWIEVTLVIQFL